MKTHLIIGAGQLGSRHLQGLLRLTLPQTIYVVDISEASLEQAKARSEEIEHRHTVVFQTSLEHLPSQIDIAIVATGASIRERITTDLLSVCSVGCLVLEKVLFQSVDAYERIADRIRESGTRAWVNHPRRMFSHYRTLKETLRSMAASPVIFQVTGTSWGLGCNALHLLDLISFLTGASLQQVETNWIDPVIHPSKREGHIEFTGTLKAVFGDGSHGTISSLNGTPGPLTITIATATDKWIIQEGGTPGIIHIDGAQQYEQTFKTIEPLFQSTLTTQLAEYFYAHDDCQLPTYGEAMNNHLVFLESMLQRYEEITGTATATLAIT